MASANEQLKLIPGMDHFAWMYDSTVADVEGVNVTRVCSLRNGTVNICYEILGPESAATTVIVTPGGQRGIREMRGFATHIVSKTTGVRAIVWDRRLMGSSSVNYGEKPLAEEEAMDLYELLIATKSDIVFLYGISSGARVSLILAKTHPSAVRGLILSPPTGGEWSSKALANMYYLQYVKVAKNGGMKAVMQTPYYQALKKQNPECEATVLATDVNVFVAAMQRSGEHLKAYAKEPLLGMTADEMREMRLPSLVLHHGGLEDKIHSLQCAQDAARLFPNAAFHIASNRDETWQYLFPFMRDVMGELSKL